MTKENISYEQHKLENLHKQLNDYIEITAELEAHCKAKYGISITTLKTFMNGVRQDMQKLERSAIDTGASIDLTKFKEELDKKYDTV